MVYLFAFLGGIALFLYGMELMSDGLQKAAGEKLQKILERMTGILALGILLGAVVTGVLQSSGATIVMTIGLVNAGMLTFKQAFGVIMGANIGTTMTAQLVAFKLTDYITLLVFIGFIIQLVAKRQHSKYIGQTILGFGILMIGMEMMRHAVLPLKDFPFFTDFIANFSAHPLVGLAVGMLMTVVVQSSSVTIGVLIVMASQGLIGLDGAIPVLLGDNLGSCITAVIASFKANITAKRVACSHVLFNVVGCTIFVVFLDWFIKLVLMISPAGDMARQIANAHTAFNVINTLLFMPFAGVFVRLIEEKLLPQKGPVITQRPIYLDKAMLNTPQVALSLAVKEIVRMGNLARKNVRLGLESIQAFDSDKVKFVEEHEPVVDTLEKEITDYLTLMSSQPMSTAMSLRHTCLLHACADIERIGDHGKTLAKRSERLLEMDVQFSDAAKAEFQDLMNLVLEASGKAIEALEKDDKEIAAQAIEVCQKVKEQQKYMRKSHIDRLKEQKCNAINGFVMMELIINMKRVSDHSKNIAQLVQGTF